MHRNTWNYGVRSAVGTGEGRTVGTSVTVIVPTFNERENVAELVARTAVALAGYDAEILFVDAVSYTHLTLPTSDLV